MIPGIIFAILFIVLAVLFLTGKGDFLIAGYNTASEEERKKVDIHRLRILMTIASVISAGFCCLLSFIGEDNGKAMPAAIIFGVIVIVIIILSNTWAKTK